MAMTIFIGVFLVPLLVGEYINISFRSVRKGSPMPKNKADYDFDVAIVGGGHSGCTLAAILAANGVCVACIDRDDPIKAIQESYDTRTTAISYGSRTVMQAAGVWDETILRACPIQDIHIMESGSPVILEFLAKEAESEAFGWVVENRLLRKSLYDRLSSLKLAAHMAPAKVEDFEMLEDSVVVRLHDGRTVKTKLVVGADGRSSFTREWMGIGTRGWDYGQQAVVCVIFHENPHKNVAVEDFHSEGPFAVLPMTDDSQGRHRSAIVWSEHGNSKNSMVHWKEDVFNAALNERLPSFYGKADLAGKRVAYPLNLIHAHSYIRERMALVADAAHGIHPIAGQGLNLGLRDVAALAQLIITAKRNGDDVGGEELLQEYERQRRPDNMAMAFATDSLNKLFSNDLPTARTFRKLGLKIVAKIPSAKRFFMEQAMGKSGRLPALIRQEKF
jgi:2-octaprenyl-6-methoxyphenol hydroxylase